MPTRPPSGRIGERLGKGTGSSLEFMDFRAYVPGDDLRHVDWRSYARTDQLMVRLFREEISPALEIIVDDSTSMAVSPLKETARDDLVAAIQVWGRNAGGHPRQLDCGQDLEPREALRPRSLRVLLSDFLFPEDPGPAIRRLGAGAAHLFVLQLLDPWELDPDAPGPHTFIDCETEERIDIQLEPRVVARYQQRLQRLRARVVQAARACGGSFVAVTAGAPQTMFREHLLPQGMVEPV